MLRVDGRAFRPAGGLHLPDRGNGSQAREGRAAATEATSFRGYDRYYGNRFAGSTPAAATLREHVTGAPASADFHWRLVQSCSNQLSWLHQPPSSRVESATRRASATSYFLDRATTCYARNSEQLAGADPTAPIVAAYERHAPSTRSIDAAPTASYGCRSPGDDPDRMTMARTRSESRSSTTSSPSSRRAFPCV
jgi:hypothetical protein